jgi:Glycosyl hydrolases family 16
MMCAFAVLATAICASVPRTHLTRSEVIKSGWRAPPASPPIPTQGSPAFFDDFAGPAGSTPNPAYWAVVTGRGWGGQQNFTNEGVYLDGNSNLVLQAVNNDGMWTSGRVQTAVPVYPANNQASAANLLTLYYGTLSASIQIPFGMGPGLWPAFWLLGANSADGVTWPSCGEIDVFEFAGVGTSPITSINGPFPGVLTWDFNQGRIKTASPDLSTAFHTYWMNHTENRLTFGVDSTTWGSFTPSSTKPGGEWVFNQPFYLILDLAVGSKGGWVGGPDASTPSPAKMLVDWVRWEPTT